MAQITINIPDDVMPRVVNAIARQYGYSPLDDRGNPNPETKAQFARRIFIRWIRKTVRQAEVEAAKEVAERQAGDAVDQEVEIT